MHHMRHMLHKSNEVSPLARKLRAARIARGLTQEALAAGSRTGRATLARFESGTLGDVRLGTLTRVCAVLDMEVALAPRGGAALAEVRLAREQVRARRIDARRRHAELAVRLLTMPSVRAAAALQRACAVVDRWEIEQLCSAHYIVRWRARLAGGARRAALALVAHDEWTDALLQNTPWGFALERPAA
jgi:transcriptional regulator with XRE-family HTH domain